MKKIVTILTMLVCSLSMIASAQNDVMKQAMEGYKNLTTMTAKVTKRVHNEMVTKDVTSTGMFYFKKPAKLCITTNGGKDMLVTDGQSFTMVQNGKASTASAGSNSSLAPLVQAIKSITSGKEDTDLSDVADVDMEREGDLMIMTITPIVKKAADKKKMLYQSFVITIDQKVGLLKSVRLNGKGKNYEQYDFSDFKQDVKVDDAVFVAK